MEASTKEDESVLSFSFASSVAAVTKSRLAVVSAVFLALISDRAVLTWSSVAFSFVITASAAVTLASASCFTLLYVAALSVVLPTVGSASSVKAFNSSLACIRGCLSTGEVAVIELSE